MKKIILLVVLVAFLLSSCMPKLEDGEVLSPGTGMNLQRYIDDDAGVVCWIYDGDYSGGIDCMPISETEMQK